MNKANQTKVKDLLYNLQYQFPSGVTTFSACDNECGEGARGGRECPGCITRELAEYVGSDLARRHLVALKVYKSLHNQTLNIIEK